MSDDTRVSSRGTAVPVTPDAAGVRERLEALRDEHRQQAARNRARFRETNERSKQEMYALLESHYSHRAQELDAILAALPEGELIDAGEYPAHMHYGSPAVAFPVIPTPTVGTYRIFLQREERSGSDAPDA